MKIVHHLLRAVLLGGLAGFAIGGMVAQERPEVIGQLGFAGALVGLATAVLLLLFPVGPASKVVFGAICGPFLPLVTWVPAMFAKGEGQHVPGVVVIALLIGLLVGTLDANRVLARRREPAHRDET